jgi:hypothetical protein
MTAKVVKNSRRGSKPGERRGGRKAGTLNKRTAQQVEAVISTGQTPLEYLTSVYQNPDEDQAKRIDAAKAAAPYVHPKLSVEHSGKDGGPIEHGVAIRFV